MSNVGKHRINIKKENFGEHIVEKLELVENHKPVLRLPVYR